MSASIRNLPVPLKPGPVTEIARIVPDYPVGQERSWYRQATRPPISERGEPDQAVSAGAPEPRSEQLSRSHYPARSAAAAGVDHPPPDRSFRRSLLTSASFGAHYLGQLPPYENEALLRVAATVAYRRAGAFSVDYLGAFAPIDIRV